MTSYFPLNLTNNNHLNIYSFSSQVFQAAEKFGVHRTVHAGEAGEAKEVIRVSRLSLCFIIY